MIEPKPKMALRAKLTLLEARMVCALSRHGFTLKQIAPTFGVSYQQISKIARGQQWWWGTGLPRINPKHHGGALKDSE